MNSWRICCSNTVIYWKHDVKFAKYLKWSKQQNGGPHAFDLCTGRPHVRRHFCCKNQQKLHKSYTIMIPGQFTSFLKIIQLSYRSITGHRLTFSLGSRTHVCTAWLRPGQDPTPYVLLPTVKGNLIRFFSRPQITEKLWSLQSESLLVRSTWKCFSMWKWLSPVIYFCWSLEAYDSE